MTGARVEDFEGSGGAGAPPEAAAATFAFLAAGGTPGAETKNGAVTSDEGTCERFLGGTGVDDGKGADAGCPSSGWGGDEGGVDVGVASCEKPHTASSACAASLRSCAVACGATVIAGADGTGFS